MNLSQLALAFGYAWTPVSVPAPTLVPASAAVAPAPAMVDASGAARTWEEALADLAPAQIVAVGEAHDQAEYHQVQADVLAALAARGSRLAVGLEMVSFEDQAVLDAFLSGRSGEKEFANWWRANWGYEYSLYKPVFDAAKAAGVPVLGLNAPRALVKAVSRNGLASLPPADRARLPVSIEESSDPRYREFVFQSVSGHVRSLPAALRAWPAWMQPLGGAAPTPEQIQNRIEAMAVWNETMGERAAALAAQGRTVLVIAGLGHVLYKAGVPESAARRGAKAVKVVMPWPGAPAKKDLAYADWFRVLQ